MVAEVRDYLRDQAAMLEAAGVAPERICVDPGPGFGKTASQTLELVRNFQEFARLGYPVAWLPFPAKAIWASPTASTTRSSATM